MARFKYRNLHFNAIIFSIMMTLLLLIKLFLNNGFADELQTLPDTCDELLPDKAPYIALFDQTAQLWAIESTQQAKKMFDILALRTMYQESTKDYDNPIDWLIRDALCNCSVKNKGELFNSGSLKLRKCLNSDLSKFIKKAQKAYIDLVVENNKKEKMLKLSEQQMTRIEKLREQAQKDMEQRTRSEIKNRTAR
ncbi:MAG TPA: hypothetical protein PK443_00285 [bacterium]|nr:hypothetical protein [bacterium]